jgi:fluoride exporter
VGTLLRAGGLHLLPPAPDGLPWVTLLENLAGAFLLGCLVGAALRHGPRSPWLEDFLGAGILGSFTTFSALAVDTVTLGPLAGAGYLALSVAGGLGAAWMGLRLGGGGDAGAGGESGGTGRAGRATGGRGPGPLPPPPEPAA